jgi:hypothetical protein
MLVEFYVNHCNVGVYFVSVKQICFSILILNSL